MSELSKNIISRLDEFTTRQGIKSGEWCKLLDANEENIKELEQKLADSEADWIKLKSAADETSRLLMEQVDVVNKLGAEKDELKAKLTESESRNDGFRIEFKKMFTAQKELEQKLAESEKKHAAVAEWYKKALSDNYDLNQKLSEALEVIRFYADPSTYCSTKNVRPRIPWEKRLLVAGDVEQTDLEVFPVGGKRARDFLKRVNHE